MSAARFQPTFGGLFAPTTPPIGSKRSMGPIVEAKGRQKWEVEWDWHHPNVDKRKGESPSQHLKFEEAEIDVRRRTVREGLAGGGGGGGSADDGPDGNGNDSEARLTDSEDEE